MTKPKKNTRAGKINFIIFFFLLSLISHNNRVLAEEKENLLEGSFIDVKILDKISSKTTLLKLKIGDEKRYKDLLIKSLKCKNSEFDDSPEIIAYIQVKDITNTDNDYRDDIKICT